MCFLLYRLQMIARQGTFVEYSVFGKETTVDWTVISDAKGWICCDMLWTLYLLTELTIRGGHCSPYTYPVAIRMIENDQIPLEVHVFNNCIKFVNSNYLCLGYNNSQATNERFFERNWTSQ